MKIIKHHPAHIIHIEGKGVGIAHTNDIYIACLIDHLRRSGNLWAVQLVRRGMCIRPPIVVGK